MGMVFELIACDPWFVVNCLCEVVLVIKFFDKLLSLNGGKVWSRQPDIVVKKQLFLFRRKNLRYFVEEFRKSFVSSLTIDSSIFTVNSISFLLFNQIRDHVIDPLLSALISFHHNWVLIPFVMHPIETLELNREIEKESKRVGREEEEDTVEIFPSSFSIFLYFPFF